MEIILFLVLSVLGVAAFVAGAKTSMPVISYLGLGLLLICASQNMIDGIYYRSGETRATNADGNVTTVTYDYASFNSTAIGGSDWYIDATCGLEFVFAIVSLAYFASRQLIGAESG